VTHCGEDLSGPSSRPTGLVVLRKFTTELGRGRARQRCFDVSTEPGNGSLGSGPCRAVTCTFNDLSGIRSHDTAHR
jgi:hypothetical protein